MIADVRRNSRRVLVLCSLVLVGTFALAGAVLADIVTNRIDSSIDNERETLDLVVGGPSEDVTFRVISEPLSDDGDANCNFDVDDDRLEVSVNSTDPGVASLNKSVLTFSDCGLPGEKILKVTPLTAGTTDVSFSRLSNNTGGSFNLLPARFTVSVKHRTGLSVDAASGTYGGKVDLRATLVSPTGSVGNKTVDFTINGKSVGSDTTNSSGIARLSGVDLVSASGVRLNAGAYGVGASFAGTGTYLPSGGSNGLTVNQAAQTIDFGPLAGKIYGDAPFEARATSSSGLRVLLAAKAGSDCTVSPSALLQGGVSVSTVTITGAGSCTVVASRPASTNYTAADPVEQRFDIARAPATIVLSDLQHTYDGKAKSASATTSNPSGLSVDITYNGLSTAPSNTGDYDVVATVNEANYRGSANGTLKIDKADAVINVGGFDGTYDGDAHGASGTATGVDGANLSSLLALGDPFTNVPGGTANWTFAGDDNHKAASGSVAIKIAKANTTTTVACQAGPFTYTGSAIEPCSASVSGTGLNNHPVSVTYTNNVNAGAATASATYAGNGNLNGSSGSEGFAIGRKELSVNAKDQSTVYGDAHLDPAYELGGFVNGESKATAGITGDANCLIGSAGPGVGEYADTITCAPDSLAAENYSFAADTRGDLSITARPITVTADAKSKTYGEADPDLTYQVTSGTLVNGDSLTGSLERVAGEDFGTYAIGRGTLAANSG